MRTLEQRTLLKVWRHSIPLLMAAMFCSYLDRINLGFAALSMNRDLGLSHTQFGTAAGAFAVGYAVCGIPSTLLLHRWGARRWIAITMVAWGLFSAATAWVSAPNQLFAVRLLLGVAEAGFAPGVVLYCSSWFPGDYQGRILGSFFPIVPLSQFIAGPLSSVLLSTRGSLGLVGWQWLFIVEALPTLVLAAIVYRMLSDTPADAHWLSAAERHWLIERLRAEQPPVEALPRYSAVWRVLANKRVWILAAIGAGLGTSGIGTIIFLPLIVHSMGFSVWTTGFVSSVPAAVAALSLPLWGVWADRAHSREVVVAAACGAIASGLLATAVLLPSPWAVIPISVALAAFFGCLPAFWALPTAFLAGEAAAAGIALINIAGNLGQFVGPFLLGHLSDVDHSFGRGLAWLAAIAAAATVIVIAQMRVGRT